MLSATAAPTLSSAARAAPLLADVRGNERSSLIVPAVVLGLIRAADFVIAVVAGLLAALLYVNEPHAIAGPSYLLATLFTSAVAVLAFEVSGVYAELSFSHILKQLPRLLLGWVIAFGALESALFFMKSGVELSRVWLALWFGGGLALLLGVRLALASRVRAWSSEGRLNRRAVIFGSGHVTDDLIRQLEADQGTDVRIAGIFDDRSGDRISSPLGGYPCLGDLNQLVAMSRATRIDLVIVALPVAGEGRLNSVVKRLSVLPADIKLPARATGIRFSPRTYSRIGSVPMIDIADKPIAGWGTLSKAVFDKTIAALAVLTLAPVMAAVAIAIRLDSRGPILFRQKRYGFNNELIEVLKFRSMYVDRCDAAATQLVTKEDPRVTRVGRFIRKTSLDELPQLFNVLAGTLSLVGPRPHALQAKAGSKLYDEVVDDYFARHRVKPGITGWAQINGWRGETDTAEKIEKRVEHDLFYIENWSLLLDLYILAKTPASLLTSENAY